MSNNIKALASNFGPEAESKLKTSTLYELKNGERTVPGLLVKAFARSAAGVKAPRTKDLRTERCYKKQWILIKDIVLDKRRPYNLYMISFLIAYGPSDRSGHARYDEKQTLKLLEPMACEEQIDNFDPKICNQHLQECLKRALCCYDEIDVQSLNLNELNRRSFLEAIYLLFNLGTSEALNRALGLPTEVR
ncbi:unnamed protein product [Ceratitis capitata]|uniref:(Mediterranean fruit fly) hypothetical protein n=1 Tax=Ceratitis capitata TaxID=7213 RepID=A0A811UUD3_CERCA|nr:unnamed protein product [Ceratitis capitata]